MLSNALPSPSNFFRHGEHFHSSANQLSDSGELNAMLKNPILPMNVEMHFYCLQTTIFIYFPLIFQFGMILSYVVWCFSHTFTVFVLSRIIGGLSKGNVSLSIAIMADILPQEKRGRGMVSFVNFIIIYYIIYMSV